MIRKCLLVGLGLAVAAATAAHGSVTYYTDLPSFQAAAPSLGLETFEAGTWVSPAQPCGVDPITSTGGGSCFSPGGILPTVSFGSPGATGMLGLLGGGLNLNPSRAIAPFQSVLQIGFTSGSTNAVAFELYKVAAGAQSFTIRVYGAGNALLDTHGIAVADAGTFFGIVATQAIVRVEVESPAATSPIVDDVRFGPPTWSTLQLALSGVESPVGTVTETFSVGNSGPAPATGVLVSSLLPSQLAYVADDCGGSVTSGTWTWSAGAVAVGATATCHVTVTALYAGIVVTQASATAANPVLGTLTAGSTVAVQGSAQETDPNGVALFRNFPAFTIPDQSGSPFSLRDHTGQVILLQFCAAWCTPCKAWASQSAALQTAVDTSIGAGHFLQVDMLAQGASGAPSTQTDASSWKNVHGFPGPVLHAEGSLQSPLSRLYTQMYESFLQVPSAWFEVPYYFVLAPGCDNQIEVRGTFSPAQLGEESELSSADVTDMTNAVVKIWNERPCAQPALHRLDRCSIGSVPILSLPSVPAKVESAQRFTVPPGKTFDVSAVDAVVTKADPLNETFELTVYADAGGAPGATVCDAAGITATTHYADAVHRIDLPTACQLTTGSYWAALRWATPAVYPPASWLGGVLPPSTEVAFRDPTHRMVTNCDSWQPISSCLGATYAATTPCFVLDNPRTFGDAFETGDTAAWAGTYP